MIRIVTPSNTGIYKISADTFAEMWEKVTGKRPDIIIAKEPSDVPCDGDAAGGVQGAEREPVRDVRADGIALGACRA